MSTEHDYSKNSGTLPWPVETSRGKPRQRTKIERTVNKLVGGHYHNDFKDLIEDENELSDVSKQIYDIITERDDLKNRLKERIISRIDDDTTEQELNFIETQERIGLVSEILEDAYERNDFSEIFPMLSSVQSKLLSSFLTVNGPMKDIIEGFNYFLEYEVPKQLSGFSFRLFDRPDMIFSDKSRRIGLKFEGYLPMNGDPTPEECRNKGLTYSVRVMCSIVSQEILIDANGREVYARSDDSGEVFHLCDLPIIVGCKLCHLSRSTTINTDLTDINLIDNFTSLLRQSSTYPPNQKTAILLGEDPRDPFGYFIYKGKERSKILKEMLRKGRILVRMDKNGNYVLNLYTVTSTDCVREVLRTDKEDIINIVLNKFGREKDNDAKSNYKGLNLLVLVDILDNMFLDRDMTKSGINEPEYIGGVSTKFTEMIRKYVLDENWSLIHNLWILTVQDYMGQEIRDDVYIFKDPNVSILISWLKNSQGLSKRNRVLTNGEKNVLLQDLFRNGFFPNKHNFQGEDFTSNIEYKIEMLAMLTARFLEVRLGVRKIDDMNRWYVKILETPATALSTALNRGVRTAINKLSEATNVKRENLVSSLQSEDGRGKINDELLRMFSDPKTSDENKGKSYHTTQEVERVNIISTLEGLLKITATFYKKDKNMDKRQVQELGYVCPITTPTDNKCGSTKRKSLTTWITYTDPFLDMLNLLRVSKFTVKTNSYSASSPDDDGMRILNGIKEFSDIYDSKITREEIEDNFILNEDEYYLLVEKRDQQHPDYVLHDGHLVGWANKDIIHKFLTDMRDKGMLSNSKPAFVKGENYYEISTFKGRLTRPLFSTIKEGLNIGKVRYNLLSDEEKRDLTFDELIGSGIIQYIDVEEQNNLIIASSMTRVESNIREMEKLRMSEKELLTEINIHEKEESKIITKSEFQFTIDDIFEDDDGEANEDLIKELKDNLYVIRNRLNTVKYYDYCELNPAAIFGPSAALIIFAALNQATRLVGGTKMNSQAIAQSYTNPNKFFGGLFTIFPHMANVGTSLDRVFGIEKVPLGGTLNIAFLSDPGTEEDAFILSESAADKLQFYKINVRKYTLDAGASLGRPEMNNDKTRRVNRFIGDNGLPYIGSHVEEDDYILGVINNVKGTQLTNIKIPKGEGGVIEDVKIEEDKDGTKIISIKIRSYKVPKKGSKFAARSTAQKGTASKIVKDYLMPYIEGSGQRIDVIINPHNIPSRMTMGYLVELLLGISSDILGARFDGLVFEEVDYNLFTKLLHYYNYSVYGRRVRNAITGHLMDAEIYIGPVLFQTLKHLAEEKIYGIGISGNIHPMTMSVRSGRSDGSAVRTGYMELDALLSHGAVNYIQDRFCTLSDAYHVIVCSTCGSIGTIKGIDEDNVILECINCGKIVTPEDNVREDNTALFYSTTMPFRTGIKIRSMLASMGVHTKFEIESGVERLERLKEKVF